MKHNKQYVWKMAALCLPLLLGACGTKQAVVGNGSTTSTSSKNNTATRGEQSEAVQKLTFVQKVSDNQVYSKNITGSMSFNLQMGDKDITVPGALRMRKDEVIRIQLFIPIMVPRWGAWSSLLSMCSSWIDSTRNISRRITTRSISCRSKESISIRSKPCSGTSSSCRECRRFRSQT